MLDPFLTYSFPVVLVPHVTVLLNAMRRGIQGCHDPWRGGEDKAFQLFLVGHRHQRSHETSVLSHNNRSFGAFFKIPEFSTPDAVAPSPTVTQFVGAAVQNSGDTY
jgi:hypothetical protein